MKILKDDSQKKLVADFFRQMLASSKNPEDAVYKCLTVQAYGEEAMNKLKFLDPNSTCPCFLQRLCFLVADDIEDEQEGTEVEEPQDIDELLNLEVEQEDENIVGAG